MNLKKKKLKKKTIFFLKIKIKIERLKKTIFFFLKQVFFFKKKKRKKKVKIQGGSPN
jgi:hypothetical protein